MRLEMPKVNWLLSQLAANGGIEPNVNSTAGEKYTNATIVGADVATDAAAYVSDLRIYKNSCVCSLPHDTFSANYRIELGWLVEK